MDAVWGSGQTWGAKGLAWGSGTRKDLTMPLIHVSLGFMDYKDSELDDFATNVVVKCTANAGTLGTLPVSMTVLDGAQKSYHTALSLVKGGGTDATADKTAKRLTLLGLLRQNALALQAKPGLTETDVNLSGYKPVVSGSHAPVTVNVPAILDVINVASTKLGFKITPVAGAVFYEFQGKVGNNPAQLLGTVKSTRNIVMENLISGTTYVLQVRAGYGGNRFSEWSEPVTHMCT